VPGAPSHAAGGARDTRLPVTIEPITKANWQYVVELRLAPEQANLLASNLYSLAQAYVEPSCQPRAIAAGGMFIGFVMYEYIGWQAAFNIPRFMIDERWQGHGYGAAALAGVIKTLKAERPDAGILISLMPYNVAARRLYERMGFVDTGEQIHGEDVLRHP